MGIPCPHHLKKKKSEAGKEDPKIWTMSVAIFFCFLLPYIWAFIGKIRHEDWLRAAGGVKGYKPSFNINRKVTAVTVVIIFYCYAQRVLIDWLSGEGFGWGERVSFSFFLLSFSLSLSHSLFFSLSLPFSCSLIF